MKSWTTHSTFLLPTKWPKALWSESLNCIHCASGWRKELSIASQLRISHILKFQGQRVSVIWGGMWSQSVSVRGRERKDLSFEITTSKSRWTCHHALRSTLTHSRRLVNWPQLLDLLSSMKQWCSTVVIRGYHGSYLEELLCSSGCCGFWIFILTLRW